MVKINPFMHSDIHSKISEDNAHSHSSKSDSQNRRHRECNMSLEGYEMVLNLKESLRDSEALLPERSTSIRLPTMSDNLRLQKSGSKKPLQEERAQLFSS